MRATILCLCFVLVGAAADRESITLADGRTLVGIYDETAGTIALDGGKLTVQVKADAVKTREPAPEPAAVVAKTKPKDEEPSQARQKGPNPPPLEAHAKLAAAYDRQEMALLRSWLDSVELAPLPEPKLSGDPRQSERDEAAIVHRLNAAIAQIREIKAGLPKTDDAPCAPGSVSVILNPMITQAWLEYVKRGGR